MADASSVVAEALRRMRHRVIGNPDLTLYIAEAAWSEVVHEIGRRLDAMVRHGQIDQAERTRLLSQTLTLLANRLTIVTAEEYRPYEGEARARVPRDPNDWPTVAVALALDAGVWTHDYDFFGCGVPVWITQTLTTHLASFLREA